MSSEFHIAGIVVHATPIDAERVAREIAALAGARIHASSATGKLVVTLEADAAGDVMSQFDLLRRVPGVLSAALVYQHDDIEPAASAPDGREEIVNERLA